MSELRDSQTEATLNAAHQREEEDVASILSSRYGMQYINLTAYPISPEALRLIPEDEARAARIVAFHKEADTLHVAVEKPQNPAAEHVIEDLRDRNYSIDLFLVSHRSIEHALERYKDLNVTSATKAGQFDIAPSRLAETLKQIDSLETLQKAVHDLTSMDRARRATRLLEILFAGGVALNASDIHLEPQEENARVRIRLNGILTDVESIDTSVFSLVLSRLKLISGMKLNVRNTPQDGRFSLTVGEQDIEIRSSTIPGAAGESFVMRILNPESGVVDMEKIGMRPELLERIKQEVRRPNGMILTTGPTGSGKSTTLYAMIRKIYTPDIKVITIEDPVEYKISGIVQTQVNEDYSFADGLRSSLRQDPDVILVGEIRDREVAETAMQAALTGHLVLSTLHTNSAAGTFPRLSDLGIDSDDFGAAINVVMAQRLVRKLNPTHTSQEPLQGEDRVFIEKVISTLPETMEKPPIPDSLPVPVAGSPSEGYQGRIGVFEALFMDDAMNEFLRTRPNEHDIEEKMFAQQGSLTMLQDGILKVLAGDTTLAEIRRVVGEQ